MSEASSQANRTQVDSRANAALFWVCMSVSALVPLAFSTSVYRTFVLPKFSILIVGSALILMMTGLAAYRFPDAFSVLRSKHVALVLLYAFVTAVSTVFGVVPLASLFGSFQSEMGLISRLCFLACFSGVVVSIGRSDRRLIAAAWVVATTGFVTAFYAFIQFFGWDPLMPISANEYPSAGGFVVRAIGTLGHSNYLGNFLLYTCPLGAALAFAWRGRTRRIAIIGVAFSIAAIAFSGTRGAWVGLLVSTAALTLMEARTLKSGARRTSRRGMLLRGGFAAAAVLGVTLIIVSNPASRNIATRVRSFAEEGFTGAGRILLWRDSIRMVPRFAVLGCGPEAFRREFLRYKSFELARSAPQINNESSHNSYLDAAISFGLPGATLYVGLIASAFSLLVRARRRAVDRKIAWLISGLVASLAGVVVHNLFIYDQIPTGLYFFLFTALALAAWNVSGTSRGAADPANRLSRVGAFASVAITIVGMVLVVAATWFAVSLVGADVAAKRAIGFAAAGDLQSLIDQGSRVTSRLDFTRAYDLQFARALTLYVDGVPHSQVGETPGHDQAKNRKNARREAMRLASNYALKSLPHTLTPDANYMLLAYLAFREDDLDTFLDYTRSAVECDPNYFYAHWLRAEALLADGDRDGAVREAEIALQINPTSSEAQSVLARAGGGSQFVISKIERRVDLRARRLLERGDSERAETILNRAIRRARGPCPDYHRELALTYEQEQRYENAIVEWELYAREAPDQAQTQGVTSRIDVLRRK
jgi:tetratricopeptide (TPR) repeat protein